MPALQRISRLGFVNCYLVGEDDGLTLVDTLLPGSAKRIIAAADGMERPIARIVLTRARRQAARRHR
jgi:glyoxylase-like metal-dependent hydrolase (beta-lactamase superfamily II)